MEQQDHGAQVPGGIPAAIAAVIGDAAASVDSTGKSAAQVLLFPEHVLKIRPADSRDTEDVAVLRWLSGRLPVPQVAAHAVQDGRDWLLMTRVGGRMLCDPSVMRRPTLLLDCLAEGLHLLWDTDISGCPFRRSLADELDAAERNLRSGRFDPANCEAETFGPGGFRDADALLDWLRKNPPPAERVLSHGDYCLPNIFERGGHVSGFIDLGDCGVADPWRDLSLGWRSLKHNSDGHFAFYPGIDPDDLFRAVGVPKDEERLRYYLLLDELF